MGTWYLSLALSLFLILVGLWIHWSVVLVGALLPFIPMLLVVVQRRRRRDSGGESGADEGGERKSGS